MREFLRGMITYEIKIISLEIESSTWMERSRGTIRGSLNRYILVATDLSLSYSIIVDEKLL